MLNFSSGWMRRGCLSTKFECNTYNSAIAEYRPQIYRYLLDFYTDTNGFNFKYNKGD